jgi:hypothetical protein
LKFFSHFKILIFLAFFKYFFAFLPPKRLFAARRRQFPVEAHCRQQDGREAVGRRQRLGVPALPRVPGGHQQGGGQGRPSDTNCLKIVEKFLKKNI